MPPQTSQPEPWPQAPPPPPPPRRVPLRAASWLQGSSFSFGVAWFGSGVIGLIVTLILCFDEPTALSIAAVLCGIFIVGGLVIAVPAYLFIRRTRETYRRGVVVIARVTDHVYLPASSPRPVKAACYVFTGPSGPLRGSWSTPGPPPKGSLIWVLYDPSTGRSVPADFGPIF